MIGLVLFDLDGVLVDSGPISTRVLMGVLAQVGLPLNEAATRRALWAARAGGPAIY